MDTDRTPVGSKRSPEEWVKLVFGNKPSRVLFRVDAGRVPGLSFGHLSRCLLFSQFLQNAAGTDILFIMRNYQEGIAVADKIGITVHPIDVDISGPQEERVTGQIIEDFNPDWLVIDIPYSDYDLTCVPRFRQMGAQVLFIDDSRFVTPNADVIWNSSILAAEKIDKTEASQAQLLLGPDYFLIEDTGPKSPYLGNGQINVAVTLGGSDPAGLTEKICAALKRESWAGIHFSVILGPGFPKPLEKNLLSELDRLPSKIIRNPPDMLAYLKWADVVVCNGGRTLYEALYFKTPVLPVATAPHEREVIESFIEKGLIREGITSWSPEALLVAIRQISSRKRIAG